MAIVPFEFDGDENEDELQFETEGTLTSVGFAPAGITIIHESSDSPYPSIESIARCTPGFALHGMSGYSIGDTFAEFLIMEDNPGANHFATLDFAGVEISLGRLSPLGQYIFDGHEVKHYHQKVYDLWSLRLHGVSTPDVERYVLAAVFELRSRYGLEISLYSYEEPPEDWYAIVEEDGRGNAARSTSLPPPPRDLVPLRLWYAGTSSYIDEGYAFLQLYRILEYYAYIYYLKGMRDIRWDETIDDEKYMNKIDEFYCADEREMMCRLVSRIGNATILAGALATGLIDKNDPGVLGNAIYDARNAMVHGKKMRRVAVSVASPFGEDAITPLWVGALKDLAIECIRGSGGRR